jgi:antitoxin HigA-1
MPRTAIHPGEHLADAIGALGITAAQLARDIQVPPNRVTGILHGARAITADTALRLARYFGTSAEFWMNLQQLYELRLAEKEIGAGIKSIPRRKTGVGHEIHSPAA